MGLLVSNAIPVTYQSISPITVTIDYARTGTLSDVQEDQVMRGIGSVIESSDVITALKEEIKLSGFDIGLEELSRITSIERENSRWLLIARSSKKGAAEIIANKRAYLAERTLNKALSHSENLAAAQKSLDVLAQCVFSITSNQRSVGCQASSIDDYLKQIEQFSEYIEKERELSLGLMPALTITFDGDLNPSSIVARFDRGILIVSGAMIGLVLSFIVYFYISHKQYL